MDKNSLMRSNTAREIKNVTPDYCKKIEIESDNSVIKLPGGNTLTLTPKHIEKGLEIFSRLADGYMNIKTIQEQGEQAVKTIQEEIKRIEAEAKSEIIKRESAQKDWTEKFDKKTELFFKTIDKIESSTVLSEDVKKLLLVNLGSLLQ